VFPDPFDGARIPMRVPVRRLPSRPYSSRSELADALRQTPIEWLDGEAVGANPNPEP
jgi:hypothetical protein